MIATGHKRLGEQLIQQWRKGKDIKKWANWFKAQPKISSDVGFRCQAPGDQPKQLAVDETVSVT